MIRVTHIVARTIWGEARGEGDAGMTAVACVIMNRARNPRWWGMDPDTVCTKPYQFSCWNDNDPNLPKLLTVNGDDPQFQIALGIEASLQEGTLRDVTFNADSYFAVGTPKPSWAAGLEATVIIGSQAFYRVELAPPA